MFSSDAPVAICILKFYPNHSTLLYMIELEETDPFTMSLEIFPQHALARPARTVAPEHLAAPMHKHTILMLTTGHTRPNCRDCDCSKLLLDTCADDCVITNSH